eukprot:TRINITY_DN16553_c0_g6_i2.p2 TRINITY_DN16553_c0_g6~~TRINITY_DN16553_c0_g6_i2.p2  ORF type:complete len:147 (-),score=13.43 TRINITY_DN16553_c0_g6_i2:24-464(-)
MKNYFQLIDKSIIWIQHIIEPIRYNQIINKQTCAIEQRQDNASACTVVRQQIKMHQINKNISFINVIENLIISENGEFYKQQKLFPIQKRTNKIIYKFGQLQRKTEKKERIYILISSNKGQTFQINLFPNFSSRVLNQFLVLFEID